MELPCWSPMNIIRKIGLMAECYFLYYEELDWGNRIRNAGYELWYVHDSTVFTTRNPFQLVK